MNSAADLHNRRAQPPAFVGRESELALVGREIARAASGSGSVLVVRGEAGVGKTRLVREALARAEAQGRGLLVRSARCSDAVGTPAFWPWRRILGSSEPLDGSRDELDRSNAQRLDDPFARLQWAAARIFDECQEQGQIVVLDDLQWADAASIRLLDLLAQSIEEHPLAVIATLRDTRHPSDVDQAISALERHRSVRSIPLAGWSPDEVEAYLAARGSDGARRGTIREWHRVTGGNPYFVEELVRADFQFRTGEVPPAGARRLIELRIASCDTVTRSLVELAAVIGRAFPLALARRLAIAVGDAEIEASALERAIAAHLLEPADEPEHFRFVHALVAEAIVRAMPIERLAQLHGRLGELLAAEPGLRRTGLAEVARHLATAAATSPAFAEAAVRFSRWAGWEASLAQSHELAAEHYRAAVAALAARPDPADAADLSRAELGIALGHSLSVASPADADAALDEAAGLAEAGLEGPRREHAATLLALAVVVRAQHRCPVTADACRVEAARASAALDALGDCDGRLRAQLLAALSLLLAFESDREQPAAYAREALAVAAETGDAVSQGRALEALHWVLLDGPSADERLAVASRALTEANRSGSERLAATARYWRYVDLLELGNVDEAEAELAEIDDVAQRVGDPRRRHEALTLRAGLAVHRGRLDLAEALAGQAAELGHRAALPESPVCHEAVMTRIAYERDDVAGISNRESLRSPLRSQVLFQVSNPMILRWQGRDQSASADMQVLKTRDFESMPHGPDRLVNLYTLAWASCVLEDREAARALYDLLEPHAERIVVFHLGAFTGVVARVLANLAALLGKDAAVQRHLQTAFSVIERSDARLEWAHLHLERAEMRIARGTPADAEPVLDDLRSALVLAREVGSQRVVNRIRASHPDLVREIDPEAASADRTGRFERCGDVWRVGVDGRDHELPDARGLQFIAALLARPGEERLATSLVADVSGDLDVSLERARLRVTQRVRASLAQLRELDPALAIHLANALRTGNYCAYLPRADDRVTWRL